MLATNRGTRRGVPPGAEIAYNCNEETTLMSTSTFDTLDAMRRLEQAGMERAQAEATVETIREARSELATKADLSDLRSELAAVESRLLVAIAELRADLYRALWIQGAGIVAINSAFIATAAALGLI